MRVGNAVPIQPAETFQTTNSTEKSFLPESCADATAYRLEADACDTNGIPAR
jgi:hypothetical protein